LSGKVLNLSRHGLYLDAAFLDKEGSKASVSIDLPMADESLRLEGLVVRVANDDGSRGMAIHFPSLCQAAQRQLANFMLERQHRD
jgi:hypothetical protein